MNCTTTVSASSDATSSRTAPQTHFTPSGTACQITGGKLSELPLTLLESGWEALPVLEPALPPALPLFTGGELLGEPSDSDDSDSDDDEEEASRSSGITCTPTLVALASSTSP